jgi:pimeloyl-ACP methyl ester carboxylesterase
MAPCASGIRDDYAVDRLKGMPVMAVVGELDTNFVQPVRDSVARLNEQGIDAEYVEVEGGGHSSAVEEMMPRIYEFFAQHRKQ